MMDGSLGIVDVRYRVLVAKLEPVLDFETARQIIRAWANDYRLQPCTTIASEDALLISYHDETKADVNYGCCRYVIPYAPGQVEYFKTAYQSARDGW